MPNLVIRISGEMKDFDRALEAAQSKTAALGDRLGDVAKVSGVAFAALTAEIGLAVHAYEESEAASRKLTQSLQNQGLFTKELRDTYKGFARAVQEKTGIDDDALIAAQAQITAMTGQKMATDEVTMAIADLAAAQNVSVEAAGEMIARGINGQTRAFKQLGIELDENATKQERMGAIVAGVSQKIGGQAEAANQGIGAIRGLRSAISDLQEGLGERFAPAIGKAILAVKSLVEAVSNSPGLLDFAAGLIGAGAAVAGLVSAVAASGAALIALQATFAAVATVIGVSVGTVGLVVAAVAALAAGVVLLATNWRVAWAAISAVTATYIDTILQTTTGLREAFLAMFTWDTDKMKAGFEKARLAVVESLDRLKFEYATRREEQLKDQMAADEKQDAAKAANAARVRDKEAEQKSRERAAEAAANEARIAQLQGYSAKYLAFKQAEADSLKKLADENFKGRRDLEEKHAAEAASLAESQARIDQSQRRDLNTKILADNEEFQALSVEQQRVFLSQNGQAIADQLVTNENVRMQLAAESAAAQVAEQNAYLKNFEKYGKRYAEVDRAMNSERVNNARQLGGQLAELANSSSAELKAIGKAAAITNITIDTARGATAAYARAVEAFGPIFGPPLGLGVAALLVAYGAEQIGRVTAARDGGLITGGIPGMDSVPAMLTPGELVVPAQNFDEVVSAVRGARGDGGGGGTAHVVVEFKAQEFGDMVEASLVARQRLGVSILGA